MAESPDARRKRLRWLCRRGMKELDVCLNGWLERQHALDGPRLQAFEALLQWPDDRLWDALRGAWQPSDPRQREILAELVRLVPARPGESGR